MLLFCFVLFCFFFFFFFQLFCSGTLEEGSGTFVYYSYATFDSMEIRETRRSGYEKTFENFPRRIRKNIRGRSVTNPSHMLTRV